MSGFYNLADGTCRAPRVWSHGGLAPDQWNRASSPDVWPKGRCASVFICVRVPCRGCLKGKPTNPPPPNKQKTTYIPLFTCVFLDVPLLGWFINGNNRKTDQFSGPSILRRTHSSVCRGLWYWQYGLLIGYGFALVYAAPSLRQRKMICRAWMRFFWVRPVGMQDGWDMFPVTVCGKWERDPTSALRTTGTDRIRMRWGTLQHIICIGCFKINETLVHSRNSLCISTTKTCPPPPPPKKSEGRAVSSFVFPVKQPRKGEHATTFFVLWAMGNGSGDIVSKHAAFIFNLFCSKIILNHV